MSSLYRLTTTLFDSHESTLQGLKDNLHQKNPSTRGFVTHTGMYQGTPVSIVVSHFHVHNGRAISCAISQATGMGMSMMDFMVREARAVTGGDMAVVRLGMCGGLQEEHTLGSVVVTHQARAVQKNYAVFIEENSGGKNSSGNHPETASAVSSSVLGKYYNVTPAVEPSSKLRTLLQRNLEQVVSALIATVWHRYV